MLIQLKTGHNIDGHEKLGRPPTAVTHHAATIESAVKERPTS